MSNLTTKPRRTNLDKIAAYLTDTTGRLVLTDKQEELMLRYKRVFDHLSAFRTPTEVFDILTNDPKINLSKAQVYRDIKNAQRLYGDIGEYNERALRNIAIKMTMKAYEMAKDLKDIKEMNASIRNLSELGAKFRPEVDTFDPTRTEPHEYVISISKEDRKLMEQLHGQGRVNLSELAPIEDIEFDEADE